MDSGLLLLRPNKAAKKQDRISNLPEHVLHHILSFLDVTEVMPTSLLSRRWRYMWRSVPELTFDFALSTTYEDDPEYLNFVDKVLLCRDNSCMIRTIRILCDYFSDDASRIEQWMSYPAVQCVKEVHLEIYVSDEYMDDYFFTTLFVPSNVEILRLKIVERTWSVQIPDWICSSRVLRTLELVSVCFPRADSNSELIISCPVLENLIILCCSFHSIAVLNISTFQLKNLTIDKVGGYLPYSRMLKMCTPNLTSFQKKDIYFMRYCCLESLSSLISAHIVANEAVLLVELLTALYNVKTLHIYLEHSYIEAFPGVKDESSQLFIKFSNLRNLKVFGQYSISCIRVAAGMLRNASFIETLALEAECSLGLERESVDCFFLFASLYAPKIGLGV